MFTTCKTIAFPVKLNVGAHLWKFYLWAFIPPPNPDNKMDTMKSFFRAECIGEEQKSWIYYIILHFLIRGNIEERLWKQNQFAGLDLTFCLVTIWLLRPNSLWGNNSTHFKAIASIGKLLNFLSQVYVLSPFVLWTWKYPKIQGISPPPLPKIPSKW